MTADAMVLIEGEYGVSPDFEWRAAEHDAVIGKVAETNLVDSEWDVLRDIIKYKLSENVLQFIKDSESQPEPVPPPIPEPPFVPLSNSPELVATDGPLPPDAPPPPSPSPPYLVSPLVALDLQPSTPLGLVIAPFQPRPNLELNGAGMNGNGAVWDTGSGRALPARLSTDEAKEELGRVFAYLHDFDEAPPFTVQRLAELAANPRGHYKSVGKYIRALERTLLVTSTHKDYPLDTYALDVQNGAHSAIGGTPSVSSRASTPAPLDLARSPLFTPIPFLHRAAPNSHRSLSLSPPPTSPRGPLPGDASGDANLTGASPVPDSSIPALGLVDELDDPRPGHLSDHPTALSSVTQLPEDVAGAVVGAPALGDRFVSAGSVEPERAQVEGVNGDGAVPAGAGAGKVEDAEGYVRASTPEPSPTRVLAEEVREREIAAAADAAEKLAEGSEDTKEKSAEGENAEEKIKEEKKEESDRMVVDEPDEDKENVPS